MEQTRKIICPECGKEFSYFTLSDSIECVSCGNILVVEPMPLEMLEAAPAVEEIEETKLTAEEMGLTINDEPIE